MWALKKSIYYRTKKETYSKGNAKLQSIARDKMKRITECIAINTEYKK